jgi:NAD(P)-dependent dehydrogenase (short-subunit alcohol dehydrogenase family)
MTVHPMTRKVAVVTGASGGFGLITSLELARAGFRVIATMRNLKKRTALDEAVAGENLAAAIEVRHLDVTAFDTHAPFFEAVVGEFGTLDVLVNNAGFSMAGFAEDVSLQELREQFETNFFGAVSMTKAALPHMRRQRSGHVIQLSSVSGRYANAAVSSYTASKFALEGWSEALRLEMNPLGIRIVLVEPGAFATDIWEKNVRVGRAAFNSDSPNKERSLRFRDYVRDRVPKRDPREVAQLVAALAQDPYPNLRYLVGQDAKTLRILDSLVPWKIWERIVEKRLGL